jgi:hypothetical protein
VDSSFEGRFSVRNPVDTGSGTPPPKPPGNGGNSLLSILSAKLVNAAVQTGVPNRTGFELGGST